MGFPFLSGFYSKELIVGRYLVGHCSLVRFLLLFLSLAFTVFYAFRLIILTVRDGGLSGETHYKMERGFYMLSLIFMANGSISIAVVIQSYFTFVIRRNIGRRFLRGDIFYLALGMVILTSFNIFLFMLLGRGAVFNNIIKRFLRKM